MKKLSEESLKNLKVVSIDQLRINSNIAKVCNCSNRKFVVDTNNKKIICNDCGAIVDAYEAMFEMAVKGNRLREQVEMLLQQRKQILNYKPWLLTIRKLEKKYRGKKMLPCCPRCDEPFYLEELTTWSGKLYADARIKKWKEMNEK